MMRYLQEHPPDLFTLSKNYKKKMIFIKKNFLNN